MCGVRFARRCLPVCLSGITRKTRTRALDDHHRKYIRACLCVSLCASDAMSNTNKKNMLVLFCVCLPYRASFWGMGPASIDEFWAILLGILHSLSVLSFCAFCMFLCLLCAPRVFLCVPWRGFDCFDSDSDDNV